MHGNWFSLDEYTTNELKRYIFMAIVEGIQELEHKGIAGLFLEKPNWFTIFHKEYIAKYYVEKE